MCYSTRSPIRCHRTRVRQRQPARRIRRVAVVHENRPPFDQRRRHEAPIPAVGSSCRGCRPARSSSALGRPAGPSCFATDARLPDCSRRTHEDTGAASRNSSSAGSIAGSVMWIDVGLDLRHAIATSRTPSRMASVSPGMPTTRLMKCVRGSAGQRNTMMSPRCGCSSAGKSARRERHFGAIGQLVDQQKIADEQRLLHAARSESGYASTKNARSTKNSARAITNDWAQSRISRHRNPRRLMRRSATCRRSAENAA